ncbi:MAG: lipopolysaccharide core heptose(I) kinase RfaP [Planctomycetota bacterium]
MTDPIDTELRALLAAGDPIAALEERAGEELRRTPNRRTFRLEVGGRAYFAKVHRGWELHAAVTNLLKGAKAAPDAFDEARALEHLAALDVPVPRVAAAGVAGGGFLGRRSYLVTEDVGTQETLDALWRNADRWEALPARERRALIEEAGRLVGSMHGAGINHRDLYLVHFHVRPPGAERRLVLLDLHRAQSRARVPRRWRVKDLAGLLASASAHRRPSRTDLLCFARAYASADPAAARDGALWRAVEERAARDVERQPEPGAPPSGRASG